MISKALLLATSAIAWGDFGHRAVGEIAQNFLTPTAIEQLKLVIPEYNGLLQNATLWADEIKINGHPLREKYRSYSVLHYVDAQVNPTEDCKYDDDRDCKNGNCIVGAIARFAEAAKCGNSQEARNEAVKFLAHLLGDITMPLHVCSKLQGGNKAPIVFDGQKKIDGFNVQLHSTWDYHIPNKHVRVSHNNDWQTWVNYLLKNATESRFDLKTFATAGVFELNQNNNSVAAIEYASDATPWNCDFIWGPYYKDPNQDFGGEYFEGAWPIANIQILKGGLRLANHLNKIFESCDATTGSTTTTTIQATTTTIQATTTTTEAKTTTTEAKTTTTEAKTTTTEAKTTTTEAKTTTTEANTTTTEVKTTSTDAATTSTETATTTVATTTTEAETTIEVTYGSQTTTTAVQVSVYGSDECTTVKEVKKPEPTYADEAPVAPVYSHDDTKPSTPSAVYDSPAVDPTPSAADYGTEAAEHPAPTGAYDDAKPSSASSYSFFGSIALLALLL
jgi:hypothetical protein